MPPQVDLINSIMGNFGKYQLYLCFVIFICKFFCAYNQMAIIYLGPKVSYTCEGEIAINTCPCAKPVYNTSIFTRSMTMEWNLICGRKWLLNFSQTLFQFGTLIGSISFGMAADSIGRKKPLLLAVTIQLIAGVASVYSRNYWTFTFLRFIVGISVGGIMVTSFVMLMEFIGSKYRDVIAACYQIPFNLGQITLSLFGYHFRDFMDFQLAISAPSAILLTYFVLLPETPRWLITVNRTDEAVHILERVAKVNKLPTGNIRSDIEGYQAEIQNQVRKGGNILDLFRTPNIRKNILCMSMNWLACSYCFYGISQYIGHLSGNVFVNVTLGGCFSLLGTLVSIPMMKALKRKTILVTQHCVAVGCLLTLAITPEGNWSVVLAVIGVMATVIVFVVVYLYCGEMFPTVVRNAAVGFSSMMARVGSMIAPFVVDTREKGRWAPPLLFAVFPLIGACLACLLPETKGRELTNTIKEGEAFGKKITRPNPSNAPSIAPTK